MGGSRGSATSAAPLDSAIIPRAGATDQGHAIHVCPGIFFHAKFLGVTLRAFPAAGLRTDRIIHHHPDG
jgi:hypothetical protein